MNWEPARSLRLILLAAVVGCSQGGPHNEQFKRLPDPIEIGNESEPTSANQAMQVNQSSENISAETRSVLGPQSAADNWLIGNWIGPGGSCFHATVYNADGSWFAGGNSGTWTLAGDTLIHTQLQQESSDAETSTPVVDPRPAPSTIISRTTDAFTQRGSDGQGWEMTRCPPNP